jgi:ribosomal protein L16 Arg81 hydroxylase
MSQTFSSLIYPVIPEDFKRNYHSRNGLYIEGSPEKYAEIFDWNSLNKVLDTSFMVREDLLVSLPESSKFFDPENKSELIENCNNGATIQLSHLEKYSFDLNKMADKLANELQANVAVTIFASYPEKPGYDIHFDGYDAFILQIDGEKRWQLFEPAREEISSETNIEMAVEEYLPQLWNSKRHNIRDNRQFKAEGTPGGKPPYLDKVLKPGDFLYVPAGHWHKVTPGDKETLHLTIRITYSRGMDFFVWFKDKLQNNEFFHDFFPLTLKDDKGIQQANALKNFTENLKNKISENLNQKNLLSEYKKFLLVQREPAQVFNFPYHYLPDTITEADEKYLRKNIEMFHLESIEPEYENKISVTINGREIIVDKSLAPFISFIFKAETFTIKDLFVNLRYNSFRQVLTVLDNFIRNNIITIVED